MPAMSPTLFIIAIGSHVMMMVIRDGHWSETQKSEGLIVAMAMTNAGADEARACGLVITSPSPRTVGDGSHISTPFETALYA